MDWLFSHFSSSSSYYYSLTKQSSCVTSNQNDEKAITEMIVFRKTLGIKIHHLCVF